MLCERRTSRTSKSKPTSECCHHLHELHRGTQSCDQPSTRRKVRPIIDPTVGPLFFESLAKIVGRCDVVSPRDVTVYEAPNVLDRLHVRRICSLKQQIEAFHLSELGRGVRCVRSGVVQLNAKIAMAKPGICHRQDVYVQSRDYASDNQACPGGTKTCDPTVPTEEIAPSTSSFFGNCSASKIGARLPSG